MPDLTELLEPKLFESTQPRLERLDLEMILVPRVEVEAAFDLLGRRVLDQRLAVFEADLVDELVDFVRRESRDDGGGVVGREQRLDPLVSARTGELGSEPGQGTACGRDVAFAHV